MLFDNWKKITYMYCHRNLINNISHPRLFQNKKTVSSYSRPIRSSSYSLVLLFYINNGKNKLLIDL